MNYKFIALLLVFFTLTACDQKIYYAGVFEIETLDDDTIRICATHYNVDNNLSGIVRIPAMVYGKKVVEIGNAAFKKCEKVREFIIPDTITTIEPNAFYDCKSLTSVVFEEPNGWKAGSSHLLLTDPHQNAVYLRRTYCNSIWQRK